MKKTIMILFLVLLFTSCGALKLDPKKCRSDGEWSNSGEASENKSENELKISENYWVFFFDHQVVLADILKKNEIDCRQVKKISIKMETTFFINRSLTIFIQKYVL